MAPKWAFYEIIEIGTGVNKHRYFRKPIDTDMYKAARFVKPRSLLDQIKSRVHFIVVMKDNKQVTLGTKAPLSSELLYIAETSGSLKGALKSLFSGGFGGFGGRKVIFVIGVVCVGIVVYFIATGQLNIMV